MAKCAMPVGKLPLPGAERGRKPSREAVEHPGEGWGGPTRAGRGDEFENC